MRVEYNKDQIVIMAENVIEDAYLKTFEFAQSKVQVITESLYIGK